MSKYASKMRILLMSAVCAVTLAPLGAGGVFAGELTGNDKPTAAPENANSICAFSGQNDTYSGDPDIPDGDGFTRTQNWGQITKEGKEFLTSLGAQPGDSCNGHTGWLAP